MTLLKFKELLICWISFYSKLNLLVHSPIEKNVYSTVWVQKWKQGLWQHQLENYSSRTELFIKNKTFSVLTPPNPWPFPSHKPISITIHLITSKHNSFSCSFLAPFCKRCGTGLSKLGCLALVIKSLELPGPISCHILHVLSLFFMLLLFVVTCSSKYLLPRA